jgi:hypothetical protein
MRLPRQINHNLLLLVLFAAQKACAQLAAADDFFNSGAQLYISNNIPAALEKTQSGLKIYPDNEKLKKLEALLKQQQQQNQQNQSQPQKSQQNSSGQKNQPQQNQQPQNSQAQPKPEEPKQDQSGQKNDEQQKSAADKKNGEKPEDQNAEGRPVAPGQMTPAEAKRLLDSQKDNEQFLALKPQGKPEDNHRPVKDW